MFVRWERQDLSPHGKYGPSHFFALSAKVIKSQRINGTPTPRFIVRLGTITVYDRKGSGCYATLKIAGKHVGWVDPWAANRFHRTALEKLAACDRDVDSAAMLGKVAAVIPWVEKVKRRA